MNDDIFDEIADQLRPDPQVRARLFAELDAEPAVAALPRRRSRWAWVASVAAVALVAGLAVLPSLAPKSKDLADPPTVLPPSPSSPAADPGDYAEAYSAVQQALAAAPQHGTWNWAMRTPGSIGLQYAASEDTAASAESATGTWATNSQVAGIDEGDVVKSDGHTIFASSGQEVVLVSADGAATTELARIDTTAEETDPTEGTVQGPVVDLMLHGTSLVVMVTEYTPRLSSLPSSEPLTYVPYDASQTRALVYDVADPSQPRFVTTLGQSGSYVTSRLSGDLLYLVTGYTVADRASVDRDDPATFVPSLFQDRQRSPVDATDLLIMPSPTGPSYTVVSSIDLVLDQRVDTQSVLGDTDVTYMSEENLFLASTDYETTPLARFAFDEATGLREASQETQLVRVALDDGRLSVGAQGSVPGMPLNQFALDEHAGHLRVAVTMDGATTSGGWATYPALFVLDDGLDVVGSLPQLAVNERIQSVRFDGPLAYVVTFRQVDPLFAIDLSIPAAPKVMSALKIPGFSTYLHPWSDGRLLGLGMDATDTGLVTGLKLSMFDTSDPFNVTEAATLKVPASDAEALRNHKAVFVDPERGLIGFATTDIGADGRASQRYLLYRYDDTAGFKQLQALPVRQSSSGEVTTARGLRIDGHLYVVSPAGLDGYLTGSLAKVATADFVHD
ncbi:Secreted protein containing C-terminal beta-propeller domain [Tessaracoccus bendigoensis DSM 12906]|uniref:Secreted protein containing C-terminal beta-propeller domain n=1 Tax=Tessaracoccus bendigoensis DSM 12906 TaxID=1123357 RepID=A0A1M6MCN9_9ACTN|nr:beta-propeller domain-containing protein [Tessaracoccus bendigoensis]SHJ81170.1 Secreted protein containing C-terminal beta-propeller domain [Tessaracoccus bendigoensis DSM 12906]